MTKLAWFQTLSFRTKLIINAVLISFISVLMIAITLMSYDISSYKMNLLERSMTTARLLGSNSSAALVFAEQEALKGLLQTLDTDRVIEHAHVYRMNAEQDLIMVPLSQESQTLETTTDNSKPTLFGRYSKSGAVIEPEIIHEARYFEFFADYLDVFEPVFLDNSMVGIVFLRINLDGLEQHTHQALQTVLIGMLLTMMVAVVVAIFIQRSSVRPILELVGVASEVASTQQYDKRAKQFGGGEIGLLIQVFNDMLSKIQENLLIRQRIEAEILELNATLESKVTQRTKQLTTSNQELQKAMASLQQAQQQLVESEKMASLGGLVAGVAHEINTPVGVCVTAMSHLQHQIDEFVGQYQMGQLKRREFEQFIETTTESSRIVLNNLNRAAELIQSFKKVAVDQTCEDRQCFNLNSYIRDVIASLRPTLRGTGVLVELEYREDIELNSSPGMIAQIITNLMTNALMHAFHDMDKGLIVIRLSQLEERVRIEFEDNGHGIREDNLKQIFEPFFTTRRHSGGSGLGLHIIYNMVSQTLHGSISCDSEEGRGTRFVITIPNVVNK